MNNLIKMNPDSTLTTKKWLVYNFDNKTLKIISSNNIDIDIDTLAELYVNICQENEFYVMRIYGTCTSSSEFEITSIDNYNKILDEYILQFNITEEEIEINTSSFNLDEYLRNNST